MMRALFENLRTVIIHLPLVLSDTYAGRDVSLNRLAALALIICAISIVIATLKKPELGPALTPALEAILTALVAIIGGNVIKHGIRAWKDKGGE